MWGSAGPPTHEWGAAGHNERSTTKEGRRSNSRGKGHQTFRAGERSNIDIIVAKSKKSHCRKEQASLSRGGGGKQPHLNINS